MEQIRNVLQQKLNGSSIRAIVRDSGLSRNTIRQYLRRIDQHGFELRQALDLSDEKLAAICFNHDTITVSADPRGHQLNQWIDRHGKELKKKHVTRQILWEEYRTQYPDGFGYTWFCHHLNRFLDNHELTMVFDHRPGEKMMVDFAGDSLAYVDRQSGEVIKAQVWVCVLPFSSYMYVQATAGQGQQEVADCLQQTFEYFGGIGQSVLFDNFKSAVKRADRYEPTFTELMETLAVHYGCTFMATRIKKPRDKASVETAVNVAYQRIYAKLRNRTFYSLEEINAAVKVELAALNQRPFKGKNYSRGHLFENYEKPQLAALPQQKLLLWKRSMVKVQKNYHVILGQDMHQYSVPYRFVGKTVKLCFTNTQVEVYCNWQRIALHKRSRARYGYTTLTEHMPANHRAVQEQKGWDADYFLQQARRIGPATHHAIQIMLAARAFPEQTYNACLGVLRLGENYGKQRLEAVCRLLEYSPRINYRLIKTMLQNNRDQHLSPPSEELTPDHANLRGPDCYN